MFAKGPMPGATPKEDALKLLPKGTTCQRVSGMGLTGYVVMLPSGKQIGAAGTAGQAWRQAQDWAYRNLPPASSNVTDSMGRWREPNPHLEPTSKVEWVAPGRTGIKAWVGLVDGHKVASIKRQPGHEGPACTALVDGWMWNMAASANPLKVKESVARGFDSIADAKRAIEAVVRLHPAKSSPNPA